MTLLIVLCIILMRKCINFKLEWMKNYDLKKKKPLEWTENYDLKKKKHHHTHEACVMKLVFIMEIVSDISFLMIISILICFSLKGKTVWHGICVGSGIYLHESCCPFAYIYFLQVTNFFFFCWFLMQRDNEDEELCSVFVPTNHLYIGDIFLVNSNEIIRPNLSIREGIGMSSVYVPISTLLR